MASSPMVRARGITFLRAKSILTASVGVKSAFSPASHLSKCRQCRNSTVAVLFCDWLGNPQSPCEDPRADPRPGRNPGHTPVADRPFSAEGGGVARFGRDLPSPTMHPAAVRREQLTDEVTRRAYLAGSAIRNPLGRPTGRRSWAKASPATPAANPSREVSSHGGKEKGQGEGVAPFGALPKYSYESLGIPPKGAPCGISPQRRCLGTRRMTNESRGRRHASRLGKGLPMKWK
jgi:hypothetical protein